MLFTTFKYLFLFQRYSSFWNVQINTETIVQIKKHCMEFCSDN